MNENKRHEDDIRPRQQMLDSTRRTRRETKHQIAQIVCMPCHAPPARAKKQRFTHRAVLRLVAAFNVIRLAAPDGAVPDRAARKAFLSVDGLEDGEAAETSCEDGEGGGRREGDRVAGEVLRLESVHCGQPGGGAPGEVEAEVVVLDVDCVDVPVFVGEEVDDVGCVEDVDYYYCVCYFVVQLVLECCEREISKREPLAGVIFSRTVRYYIRLHPIMPGRPLLKSFQSQVSPNRGFISTPMKRS